MLDTFLINVNCSQILDDDDENQYTMCIDSTKMSIVYELVEWIRWMFSLENCIYLTHGGSVIHELEDIQLLSELKNFEVKQCGRPQCVHKKTYRTLLKNLNLFVYWNGILVHKYFLHKLHQVDQKLSEGNKKSSPVKLNSSNKVHENMDSQDKNTNNKNLCPQEKEFSLWESKLPMACSEDMSLKKKTSSVGVELRQSANNESPALVNSYSDKKLMESFTNTSNSKANCFSDSSPAVFSDENSTKKTKRSINLASNNDNAEKINSNNSQEQSKNSTKTFSKKSYIKPFSLGELLSNIRDDFEKQNMEISKNSPTSNFSMLENENSEVAALRNSFGGEDEFSEGRKRKRVRKRKKSKKQNSEPEDFTSTFIDKNNSGNSLDFFKFSSKPKSNHIRFEVDDEDNAMETECYEDKMKTPIETQFEMARKENSEENNSGEFLKIEPKKFKSFTNDSQILLEQPQIISVSKNIENKVEPSAIDNSISVEDKLIDLDGQACNGTYQSYNTIENFQENRANPDLNMLLSLKEKCKSVVIERFY